MNRRTILTLAALVAPVAFLGRGGAEARVDAVSAASMTLKVTAITETGALVQYTKDSYDYGYRTLCYDPAPAAAKNNCKRIEVDDDKGSFQLTGLKPGTKYNYKITATDPDDDEDPYSASGNFTTLTPPTALELRVPDRSAREATGIRVDIRGRRVGGSGNAPGAFILRKDAGRLDGR